MREDYGNISLVTNDDGFGDMGFDTDAHDLMRHTAGLEASMDQVKSNKNKKKKWRFLYVFHFFF